jgi:hypothetical protein
MDEMITVSGIEDVCRALTHAPARIAKLSFARGLAAAAVPIVEAIEARVPVGTGKLKESVMSDIQVDTGGDWGSLKVGFKGRQAGKARWLEYGHRQIGHAPNNTNKGQIIPPHPFLRSAFETSAPEALEDFIAVVGDSIDTMGQI